MKWEFCGCCGNSVQVDDDVNGEDVYCEGCMGNPRARNFKKRIGWAGQMFFEARFDIIRKSLKPENQAKWDSFNYERKCNIIGKAIERGLMI